MKSLVTALAAMAIAVCLAVVPSTGRAANSADDAPQFYALYCWAENYVKYADDARKVGLHWFRVGGWHDRAWADKAALRAARRGDYLVPVLDLSELSFGRSLPLDEALKLWRQWVQANVQRYGVAGDLWKENKSISAWPIRYWEIWNEPNIEFLTPPAGLTRAEFYAKLLAAAAEEIRKRDPDAQIVAFNTAGGTADTGADLKADGQFEKLKYIGWRKFIRDTVSITGPRAFDIVATHPYSQPRGPEEGGVIKGLEMTRAVAQDLGFDQKPLWFSEVGWPLAYPDDKQVRDERQQACFVVRLLAIAAAHGVAQVQIMYVEDITYGPDKSQRSFGFFTGKSKWREQATATETMIDLLPDPRAEPAVLSEACPGVFAYQFKGVNRWPIIMAWNTGAGTVEKEFDLAAKDATLVNMLGRSSPLAITGGQVKVTLSEAPVYIVPAAKAEVDKVIIDAEGK